MDFLKDIFGENALTYADFTKAVTERKMKLADLSGGAYVSKEKLDAKIDELKEVQKTLEQKDEALKKWDGVDLEKMKAENMAETEKLTARIAELQKQNAIDTSLLTENIHDLKAVKAYLDFDIIKVNEKGDLTGLKEQMEKLQTEKPFLFKTKEIPAESQPKKLNTGISHENQTPETITTLKGAITDAMGFNKR